MRRELGYEHVGLRPANLTLSYFEICLRWSASRASVDERRLRYIGEVSTNGTRSSASQNPQTVPAARRLEWGTVKLTQSESIDPQDTALESVVNPPCWAAETVVSLNLTVSIIPLPAEVER